MNELQKKVSAVGVVPVIKLTDANNAVPLCRALANGGLPVAEITFRTAAAEESIRRVAQGLRAVDPELAAASLSIGASPLTEKEGLVLAASAGGANTAQVAQSVHLSEGTVRNYLSSAIGKQNGENTSLPIHFPASVKRR